MIDKLKSIYSEQMYLPNFIGLFINPFYFARSGLAQEIKEFASQISGSLLDVGCGSKPYNSLFKVTSHVGLDIDIESVRLRAMADDYYDGNSFPYLDSSFDSLLCSQVLEHVFNPDVFLGEINRVLKPKGKLLLTVPFVWDEHEQPYDYARYSSYGLRALLEKSGFKILEHKKIGGNATILFQLTNAYLYKVIKKWPKILKFYFTITIIALINVLGIIAGKFLPDNPDLFLDQIVMAEKCP